MIAESDVKDHPMRNFVECCLGGDHPLPDMSIGGRIKLRHGDVVLVCSDGLWSGVADDRIASLADSEQPLEPSLKALMDSAIATNAPHSDNTSAAALRLNGSGK